MREPGDPSPGATATLAHAMSAVRYEALDNPVRTLVRHCVLDWLGVTLAGSREPLTELLCAEAAAQAEGGRHGLIGRSQTVPLGWAALINGAASHALDYDDVVSAMGGHPSVPVLPALFALSEIGPTRGADFMAAFVAGFETECRVGAMVSPAHYAHGFHATGTVGTFGAAAASAHLMRLPLGQWPAALGLAGTQAAGLKCMFGTMAKPLHAGNAAANGLMAARLAARGFTAHEAVLEAEQGFAATQTTTFDPARAAQGNAARGILGVMFKYHAACFLTHASIEAARRLAGEGVQPEVIESIRVRVPPGHLRVCNQTSPDTGLAAKFSLRHTVAMALAGADTSERGFTDACARDARLVGLRERVTVEATDAFANHYTGDVLLRLADGSTREARIDISVPRAEHELDDQWQALHAKFMALAGPVLGEDTAATLAAHIARLDELADVREIFSLTRAQA